MQRCLICNGSVVECWGEPRCAACSRLVEVDRDEGKIDARAFEGFRRDMVRHAEGLPEWGRPILVKRKQHTLHG